MSSLGVVGPCPDVRRVYVDFRQAPRDFARETIMYSPRPGADGQAICSHLSRTGKYGLREWKVCYVALREESWSSRPIGK